jgi:hypothetical protein
MVGMMSIVLAHGSHQSEGDTPCDNYTVEMHSFRRNAGHCFQSFNRLKESFYARSKQLRDRLFAAKS